MIKLVAEKKLPLFKIKKYEGYGYDISVFIDNERTEITAEPSKDILLQPEVRFGYIDGKLCAALYFNRICVTDSNIEQFISFLNDAQDMIIEMKKIIENMN